ncbi:MAG: fdrA domain protein [Desulfobacterales bacterium]|nr:fdrA domain protein [Deltaproteobacteria bacterium]NNF46462.1 fdrA domain protein [Desulfofustis sp.]NNK94669.1 fdrA domain protein [Desulfobacterales bacterium]RZW14082.1 MAG: fdrA domain protein [Desulfobulbaceae bacterium]
MKVDQSPLDKPIRVINIGLESFAEDIRNADIPVIQMDWRPPAGGDLKLIALLDRLAKEA